MLEVGWSSLSVAVAGVVAPFFLGWGVSAYFLPGAPTLAHIFIGATLCATSVGITARVLKDLDALRSREARIILGAAVIDDVLGLLAPAVVAGAIKTKAAGAALSSWQIVIIALKAFTFLVGAILCGRYVMSRLLPQAGGHNRYARGANAPLPFVCVYGLMPAAWVARIYFPPTRGIIWRIARVAP
jgi:Kef-type K+ transport system membrane component KefB